MARYLASALKKAANDGIVEDLNGDGELQLACWYDLSQRLRVYVAFNKDTSWRKRRWGNHLGSECLICLAGRELQIRISFVTNSVLSV